MFQQRIKNSFKFLKWLSENYPIKLKHASLVFIGLFFLFISCHKNHSNTITWQKLVSPFQGQLLSIGFYKDTGFVLGLNSDVGNYYNALMRTTDKGATWKLQPFPVPEPGGVGLLFVYNPNLLFACKDGIFKSTDEGISWIATDSNYNSIMNLTNGVYFFSSTIGITVMGGTIYKTIDGGNHFNPIYDEQSGVTLQSLQFVSDNVGYVKGGSPRIDYGFVLKTTDQGSSWNKYPFTYGFISTLYFVNVNIGFCLAAQDIYETTDGGSTWHKKNDGPVGMNEGGKLFFINENEGFLIIPSGDILHTSNAGRDWNLEYSERGLQLNDIIADEEQNVFVIGENGLVLIRNHL
jgi:hypothetical protein